MTITSVRFKSFKALGDFSLSLQGMNVLVGPNNSGKSTIISAFRVLATGLRRARSRKPELVFGPEGETFGYVLNQESLPMSVENVHTDYDDTDTTVEFRLSNGDKLILYFPSDGGCTLIPETTGRPVRSVAGFKDTFPITVGVVPVLGPVEYKESLVMEETVRRELETHRASRHFRSYWHYHGDEFDDFAELVEQTWPGMGIKRPERLDQMSKELSMFCSEDRMDRELYWAGFGFQVWCQMLTHTLRADSADILVIDEPDIYLHPDVQRQLLGVLREARPDIILATHSAEIMSEADPSEIVLIDKKRSAARRLRDVEGVQTALDTLGSLQNITLTQLARNRRLLFVEGLEDFRRLRRFAKRLGFEELASGLTLTAIESGGFSSWKRVTAAAWGFGKTLGDKLVLGAIYDRDFRCNEEVEGIEQDLKAELSMAHVHRRKEMENYLLIPAALQRGADAALAELANRKGDTGHPEVDVAGLLREVTDPMKHKWQGQYIARRTEYFRSSRIDDSEVASEAIARFEDKWDDLSTRMEIVHGKDVLQEIRSILQGRHGINLTDAKIIQAVRREEIPGDLVELLTALDQFSRV